MTTFTSEDRDAAYQKKVEEAPYHPGYEDAVVTRRSDPVYKGMDPAKMIWKSKPMTNEEVRNIWESISGDFGYLKFARAIEKEHGIK